MPNFTRTHQPSGTFFFTLVTAQRKPILTDPDLRAALRDSIEMTRREHPFTIEAWVLIPDHTHCLLTLPPVHADFSKIIGKIKARTSKAIQNRSKPLWQRRFWEHWIRNEKDWRRHMDYIHYNPVKHGYVERVESWPYSTFHRWVKAGYYPSDWGGCPELSGDFGE